MVSCRDTANEAADAISTKPAADSIEQGNLAIQSMADAAARRDFDQYFSHYELLRQSYIDLAASVKADGSEVSKETLRQWEPMLQTARRAWRAMDVPSDDDHESLAPLKVSPAVQAQLDEMNERARQERRKINERWAPFEEQLDAAIANAKEQRGQ